MGTIRRFVSWVSKNPLLGILVLMCIAVVLLEIVNLSLPIFFPRAGQFNWEGVQPGKSSMEDVLNKAGQPIEQQQLGDTTILSYTSDYRVYPHKVYVAANKVEFVEEWISSDSPNAFLQSYIDKLSQPDFLAKAAGTEEFDLNVFLRDGIAVNAHALGGDVLFVWHFPPMNRQEFLVNFSNFLEVEGGLGQPEDFGDPTQ